MNELINSSLTMSSREIAELTGKRHDNVIRDIEKMLNELDEGLLKFEATYFNSQNKEQKCYRLPKDLTITLVSGYNVKMRHVIVNRWIELEKPIEKVIPQTPYELAPIVAKSALDMADLLGCSKERAKDEAVKMVNKEIGLDYSRLLAGQNSVGEVPVIPTTIGAKFGISPHKVNKVLANEGLQVKGDKGWSITDLGRQFGVMKPYWSKDSEHTGYRPLWFASKVGRFFSV